MKIAIDEIKCENNRKVEAEKIKQLARTIKQVVLVNPIMLATVGKGFEVIAGRCRYQALVELGFTELEEGKHFTINRSDVDLVSYIENAERNDLTLAEQVEQLEKLSEGRTVSELSQLLGRTPKWIALRVNLTKLTSKWKEALKEDKYPAMRPGHYEVVASYPKNIQEDMLDGWLTNNPGSISNFIEQVEKKYNNLLKNVPWDISVCQKCKKRSQAQEFLFDDFENPDLDRCLDHDCWDKKKKALVKKQVTKIEKDKLDISLISNMGYYYGEYNGVLSSYNYEVIDGKADATPNAFNVDTGLYCHIKKEKRAGTTTTPTKKPKTLAEKREELKHKREKAAVQAVIDFLNDPESEYAIPEHETLFRLGTLLSPDSIGGWCSDDIPYLFSKGWPVVKDMKLAHLEIKYWDGIKKELCGRLGGEIGGTLEQVKTGVVKIVCGLRGLIWDDFFQAAVEQIKEPKSWAKLAE